MMGEGSERSRRGREGQRESQDEEEIRRQMREIIDQIEREREDEETPQDEEQEAGESPEDSVRDAVKDLEREEEEGREAYEEYRRRELEREEAREDARREREETADKEEYNDLEKKILDELDKRGVDPDEMKKRWREQFVEDVMEYIGESVDGKEEGDEEEEGDGEIGQKRMEDDHSYFDDGSGQMYDTKSSVNESVSSETVTEPESESQKEDTEPSEKTSPPEGSASEAEKEQETTENGNQTEATEPVSPEDRDPVESSRHSELKAETSEEKPDSKSPESIRTEQGESLPQEESEHLKKQLESAEEKTIHDEGEDDSESTESDTDSSDWPEHYSREDEDWQRYLREIFNDLDEELKEAIREYLRGLVEDEEDLERLTRKHGLESMLEDEEAMEEVRNYLSFRTALEGQGDEEIDIEELAEEFDLDDDLARDWREGRSMPEALRKLLNHEGDWLMGQLLRAHFEQFYPMSEEELQGAKTDPGLGQMGYFEQRLEEARAWIEIIAKRRRGELDVIIRNGRERYRLDQIKDMSLKFKIPEDEVLRWLRGLSVPMLIEKIGTKNRESMRYSNFPEPPLTVGTLESQAIKEAVSVSGRKGANLETLTDELHRILVRNRGRVSFLELDSANLEEEQLDRFQQVFSDSRTTIESVLRERLKLGTTEQYMRIGLVDDRVYLWRIDRTPDDMLNVWGDRYFYFKEEECRSLLEELRQALHLSENKSALARHLNVLIRNMISDDPFCQVMRRKGKSRLLGDLLHFIRDVLELKNDYFEGRMTKVASRFGRGPIHNPKLPTGEELCLIRSQLGAIVNSDCWLGSDGRMVYYKGDLDRIRIVQGLFQKLGDIELRMKPHERIRNYRMLLPRPVGRAFIYWGFSTDDKAVRNGRLAEGIRNGSRNDWIAYLRELIPEDGSINAMSGFQWSKSIVLNPGSQDEKYELTPKLEKHHVLFIKDNGRFDRKRGYIHLQLSRYLNIEDGLKTDTVKSIESVIADNRCRLLDDEASLAEDLGIKMRVYPESITLYQKTGRVSIKWVATTQGVEDTIRWYLIAPPNDVRKSRIANVLMSHRPERVERITKQLQSEGLLWE